MTHRLALLYRDRRKATLSGGEAVVLRLVLGGQGSLRGGHRGSFLPHCPLKTGFLFSTKAAVPSALSSVAQHTPKFSASMAQPRSMSTSRPSSIERLQRASATGALAASCLARAFAVARTSEAGTTLSTRPMRRASSAVIRSPV